MTLSRTWHSRFWNALGQHRQQARQEIGRDGGDHADPQALAEQAGAAVGKAFEFMHLGEDAAHPLGDEFAVGGEEHAGRLAAEQRGLHLALHLGDLPRQGRLADIEALRRTSEMPGFDEGLEIADLPECDHARSLILIARQRKYDWS